MAKASPSRPVRGPAAGGIGREHAARAGRGPGASRTARHQVRIIGGQWRRTLLPVIDAPGVRPTPDRVRETVFNWLTHLFGGSLAELRVLDPFAGSGAMGFEAASRGAGRVVLADNHPQIVRNLRTMRDKLEAGAIDVRQGDALAVLDGLAAAGERFDLVFLDPPYGQGWLERCLPRVKSLLAEEGCVYAESELPLTGEAGAAGASAPADGAAGLNALVAELGMEVVRADKAGQVFYHLLRCKNPAPILAPVSAA